MDYNIVTVFKSKQNKHNTIQHTIPKRERDVLSVQSTDSRRVGNYFSTLSSSQVHIVSSTWLYPYKVLKHD